MLVQMAKVLGCGPVVGVVGAPHKIEACKACGADAVVCKAGRSDWWDDVAAASPDGYAAIFDANGVATCVEIKVLRRAAPDALVNFHRSLRYAGRTKRSRRPAAS